MPGSFFVTSFRIPGVQITRPLCAAAGTDVLTSGMHEHLFNIMLATIVLSASWIWQKGGETSIRKILGISGWEVPSKSRILRLLSSLASCCFVQCVHYASVRQRNSWGVFTLSLTIQESYFFLFLGRLRSSFSWSGWSLLLPWSCTGWDTRWGYQCFLGVFVRDLRVHFSLALFFRRINGRWNKQVILI